MEPVESLGDGATLLRQFVSQRAPELVSAVERIATEAPFRHMLTPSGRMSVAMTNCGPLGWVSDPSGYRYDPIDPERGKPWPEMPPVFAAVAREAALAGGFADYTPDAVLLNQYQPGTRLGLHQDKDERDPLAPVVSVSLGLPATFLWGGKTRKDRPTKIRLEHGDVVVFGGPARFRYHGVAPLGDGEHALLGRRRLNLTFRKAR